MNIRIIILFLVAFGSVQISFGQKDRQPDTKIYLSISANLNLKNLNAIGGNYVKGSWFSPGASLLFRKNEKTLHQLEVRGINYGSQIHSYIEELVDSSGDFYIDGTIIRQVDLSLGYSYQREIVRFGKKENFVLYAGAGVYPYIGRNKHEPLSSDRFPHHVDKFGVNTYGQLRIQQTLSPRILVDYGFDIPFAAYKGEIHTTHDPTLPNNQQKSTGTNLEFFGNSVIAKIGISWRLGKITRES